MLSLNKHFSPFIIQNNYIKHYIHKNKYYSKVNSIASKNSENETAIPDTLKNYVATLETKNHESKSKCYLLGISHVSKQSCHQIKELIETINPDIIMLELCKDRIGLLIDRENQDIDTWHTRKVSLEGATFSDVWPSQNEVLSLIKTKIGNPIEVSDVEDDALKLLNTGLFSRIRPVFTRASDQDAATFIPKFTSKFNLELLNVTIKKDGEIKIQTVPPLGEVKFELRDRIFPPIISISLRIDSSLKTENLNKDELQSYCDAAVLASKSGEVSLTLYLKLRKQLLEACSNKTAIVLFNGEDTGKVDIILRAQKNSDPIFVSGFEDGAKDGWGIEPFKPARRPFKLSEGMYIPTKALETLLREKSSKKKTEEDKLNEENLKNLLLKNKTEFEFWKNEDIALFNTTNKESNKKNAIVEAFGQFMTSIYSKFQNEAGRKVGVDSGAAWRQAMKSSIILGIPQIHLFDIPESISQKRLGESILIGMGLRIGLSLTLIISIITLIKIDYFPDDYISNISIATIIGTIALLWPIISPFIEIATLSNMSSDMIEDKVSLNKPIQSDLNSNLKLFGEDALLDWPGAYEPIITERDKFMTKNLFLTAKGMNNNAPTYIQDVSDNDMVSRLVMPNNANENYAPIGNGDGKYEQKLKDDLKIVGIVGTAHVRGICKEWNELNQLNEIELEKLNF